METTTIQRNKRYMLLTLFVVLLNQFNIFTQSDTEFWFVAPSVTQSHAGNTPIEIMVVSENLPTNVTISQPANPAFVPINFAMGPNEAIVTDLTAFVATIENQPANTILNYGILIESTNNITAYYAPQMQNNPDIYALKGTQALGTDFVVPMQTSFNNGNYNPVARSGFDIVATEDNTTITITPSADIIGHGAGVPFTIVLNKGETYSAVAVGGNAADRPAGSIIVADKPIAVSMKDDSVAQANCRDLIGDQLVPTNVIGDEYIVIKGYLNIDDKVYVTAAFDNTEVFVDGVLVATLDIGETHDFDVGNPTAYINSSEPIYVLHVTGFGCELGAALLPSIECTGSEQVSVTRATNEFFAINLMVAPGGEDNFVVNGNLGIIDPADFDVVPGSDGTWMFAQIDFSAIAAVGNPLFVTNTEKRFHMAVVNGGAITGCRYGYFSDFSRYEFDALISDIWVCEDNEFTISVDTAVLGAQFEWSGPNNFFEIGNSITLENVIPEQSGRYYLNAIIDNCPTDLDSVEIEIRPLPDAPEPISNAPICQGETLQLQANGVGDTMNWSGPNGFTSTEFNPSISPALPIHNGIYSVFATLNECDGPAADVATVVIPPIFNDTIDVAICSYDTYELPDGTTTNNVGFYTFDYTTIDGCDSSVIINLMHHPDMDLELLPNEFASGNNISCFGASDGSINLTITGGSPNYSYEWTGPNGFTSTAQNISDLEAGDYHVLVTDENGCYVNTSMELVEPAPLYEQISSHEYPSGDNISCKGFSDGSVNLTISGGSPGYTYSWTGPNGFNSIDENLTDLSAGTYYVTASDLFGCTISTSIELTEPMSINENVTAFEYPSGHNISCHGLSDGSINLNISGGSPDFSFEWTGPFGFTSNDQNLNGLSAGTYNVVIRDVNNCDITSTIVLTEPDLIALQVYVSSDYNGQHISCYGADDAQVTVQVSGGSPSYTVNIDGNQTTFNNYGIVDNLGPGLLTVNVTDANGCQATTAVMVNEPTPIESAIDVLSNHNNLPVSCANNYDGVIAANAIGGTPPYFYNWNHGNESHGEVLENIGVGAYTVEVTDVNGCLTISTIALQAHPNPTIETSDPQRICQGEEASFTVYSDHNLAGCNWTFETGQTFTSCNDISHRFNTTGCIDATVQVVSVNGCISELQLSDFICIDPKPIADFAMNDDEINTLNNTVSFWNESQNATDYFWDFGDGQTTTVENPSHSFPNNSAGSYIVTLFAYSEFDCVDSISTIIKVEEDMRIFVPNAFTPDGDKFNEVFSPVLDGDFNRFDYQLLIFNRWGELLFESRDAEVGWNGTYGGKVMQDGVYVWKLRVSSNDGTINKELAGHVTLLR